MRPKGWKNPYSKENVEYLDRASLIYRMKDGTCMPGLIREAREHTFEAGADAILEAIWEMARESPTGTFIFDTHEVNVPSCWIIPKEEE